MSIRFAAALLALVYSAQAAPDWIWAKSPTPLKTISLSHRFKASAQIKSARVRFVADGAMLRLKINGKPAGIAEPFGPVIEKNVAGMLKAGFNVLTIQGEAITEISAAALQLKINPQKGKPLVISTSSEWRCNNTKANVYSTGNLGLEHWWNLPSLIIDETDDYTQWKRASNAKAGTEPSSFQLLPNFVAELVRSASPDENSWVSLAFDPMGRLTVGREDKGLIRYTFSAKHEKIIHSESVNEDLRECRGLLYAHNSLYASANNSKGLYRLRDTNGDGNFDEKKLLHASQGGAGHGRNDLALGPDGKIYLINGDSIHLPKVSDRMSPLRRQFKPFRINEGHVIRMEPDGSNKEIFCGGLRNPYGIAFNIDGEAFTYDADAEFDMGTPWYRPTQVKHLTSGADFGWRAVTGSWPSYFPDHPDNTPATLDIGKGSPTGVMFGTKSNFPSIYKKALFILDWTYGRILAVHLRPRGSTYMGAAEVFLRGQPLNVTDLDFGPDGAMYFVTGGRKTQSALYRVKYTGPKIQARPQTRQELARDKQAKTFREDRLTAEISHGKTKSTYMGIHPDPRVRHARRIAMEHGNLTTKTTLGPDFEHLTAEANLQGEAARLSLIPNWPELPPSNRLAYLDLIRRGIERGIFSKKRIQSIQENLLPHFPHATPEVNQALAQLLIPLKPTKAVPVTVRLLNESTDQHERILYLYHLRHAKTGWTPESRRIFFQALSTYDTLLGGRGLPQALGRIRKDATATLTEKEKQEFQEELNQKPTLPPLPDLSGRKFVKQWKPSDFVNDLELKNADANAGKKIFHDALCSRCHRKGNVGYPIGPDLTHVSRRFSPQALMTEILEPSKTVAENYHTTILQLKDGRTLAGQIIPNLDYREPTLQLAENPLEPNKITKINKADILKRSKSETSIMPPGLLNQMEKEEVLSLLAWLIK